MVEIALESDDDSTSLLSTYSALTAASILSHFDIKLSTEELLSALKAPDNVYYQILRVPFANLVNGIICQQAYDYQVYAQKIFVDYLMSGEANESNEEVSVHIHQEIEDERKALVALENIFEEAIRTHKLFIAESQRDLKRRVSKMKKSRDLTSQTKKISETIAPLIERTDMIEAELRENRLHFKEIIIKTKELIAMLPAFKLNEKNDDKDLEEIEFDDGVV